MKGKFYAMDAICSHLYAYLPRGQLNGNIVACPFHDAQYDVTTGKVVENVAETATVAEPSMSALYKRATDVHTYKVKIIKNRILIRI